MIDQFESEWLEVQCYTNNTLVIAHDLRRLPTEVKLFFIPTLTSPVRYEITHSWSSGATGQLAFELTEDEVHIPLLSSKVLARYWSMKTGAINWKKGFLKVLIR